MYQLGGLLSGVIIAVMVSVNGTLTDHYGIYSATVIIHIAGLVFLFFALKARRESTLLRSDAPKWMYLGGVIGLFTTLFNNFSVGRISLTGLVALGLFGETATALLIDCTGLFGMQKRRFSALSLPGLAFSAVGIFLMLRDAQGAEAAAVAFSLCAGLTVVLSRTVNARLSDYVGVTRSSYVNYVTGLVSSLAALLLLGRAELRALAVSLPPAPWWAYFGGAISAVVVFLFNVIVPHIPAFQVTLLAFVGQVFAGIAIDMLLKRGWSQATFTGGLLVAAGMALNLLLTGLHALHSKKQTFK